MNFWGKGKCLKVEARAYVRGAWTVFGASAFLFLAAFGFGCETKPKEYPSGRFERPQDVALVCFDDQSQQPLPIGCCRKRDTFDDEDCGTGFSIAKLFAFVTQTTPGEVAVVDVEEQRIVDQDERTPYNSFIPVGTQPGDIAATSDGRRVYTANYESGNISVIKVFDEETGTSVIYRPFLSPAAAIDLGGPAARLFLVKSPAQYRDRYLLVTQPTLGRLSVVALDSEDCAEPEVHPDGCLLGYLPLGQDIDENGVEMAGAEIHPWAIAGSEGPSVYIGSYDGGVIWDVQTESLISRALALDAVGPLDPEAVLNDTLSIAPNTTRALSLEPKRGRWLYAVNNQNAKVIAIDVDARKENPEAPVPVINVGVPGKARTVTLVELEEEGDVGPFTFNGTFGLVATSNGGIAVIDVDDNNGMPLYPHSHATRSLVDLREDAGIPKIGSWQLTVDLEKLHNKAVDQYLYFPEDDGTRSPCEEGARFRPTFDKGIRFRCDPYRWSEETWTVTYGGNIGVTGVGVITNITDSSPGRWTLLNADMTRDFCSQEVYTAGSRPGYAGDVLVITSEPTPLEGYEEVCDEAYDKETELRYRVVGVSNYEGNPDIANVLHIERDESLLDDPEGTPDLIHECFGQALVYELRAGEQWIIKGTKSGIARTPGVFHEATSSCTYEGTPQSRLRVFPDTPYENDTIAFRMVYGSEWAETGPVPLPIAAEDEEEPQAQVESELLFKTVGGYEQMVYSALGNNIMDIELTPNDEMMLVDQAGQGLIVFDLLDAFAPIGGAVN